jgi:hypothetical protein
MPDPGAERAPAGGDRRDPQNDRLGSAIGTSHTTPDPAVPARDYLLGELRCAVLRARLAACEIENIGVALRAGWINEHIAIEWLHDCAALDFVAPASPRGAT